MKTKLTDKYVRDLEHSGTKSANRHPDTVVAGFHLRITKSGHKSFAFRYEFQGKDRSIVIGDYPVWSVTAARELAAKYRRDVDAGVDPRAALDAEKRGSTLADFWKRYRDEALSEKSEKTQKEEASIWRRLVLPKLGDKKLSYIERRDIERLFAEVSAKTPTQANRMLASLHFALRKAIHWNDIDKNPASGIAKNAEEARDRYLTKSEMARFLDRLNARDDTSTTLAIRFLLLTGARSGETKKARWDQIDWEQRRWTKPAANTKQGKRHVVPLSDAAMEILRKARQLSDSPYVFPSESGSTLYSWQKVFRNICKEAKIENFRPHDLRHSFASEIASGGTPIEFLSKLLGHSNIATTQRYAHYYDDPLREAIEGAGKRITGRKS